MEDYVTYEQAVKLKELGFDWETTHYYDDSTKIKEQSVYVGPTAGESVSISNVIDGGFNKCNSDGIDAPTLSQAQKWLREVKGIIICIEPGFYRNKRPLVGYDYHLFNKDDGWNSHIESETVYDSYEQALQQGIDKALELLK